MGATDTLEERRKKATLKKIERKNAGRVTQPYAILERLIDEVEAFHPLKEAHFCLLWKSGWKTDKDGVLTRAQIAKASEDEREKYGEYDFTIKLHRELWALKSFGDTDREMDLFHELCHAQPEIDDSTGEQKKDERDRLCWRVRRRHPIQEFPEVIERYGLDKSIGMNASALTALEEEDGAKAARAEENDANRPLLAALDGQAPAPGQPSDSWKQRSLSAIGLSDKAQEALELAGILTCGQLQAEMTKHGDFWMKNNNVHGRFKTHVEDLFTQFVIDVERAEEKAKQAAEGAAREAE